MVEKRVKGQCPKENGFSYKRCSLSAIYSNPNNVKSTRVSSKSKFKHSKCCETAISLYFRKVGQVSSNSSTVNVLFITVS